MQFINKQKEPEKLLVTSQHSPMWFLIKGLINFAWILFGFRVLLATRSNGVIPLYAPFLSIVGPAAYCFWRNWTKFHTCIQIFNNKIVIYPEDKSPQTIGYLQLKALILKKKALELMTPSESITIPVYTNYKKVFKELIQQHSSQTGTYLVVVDERKVKNEAHG